MDSSSDKQDFADTEAKLTSGPTASEVLAHVEDLAEEGLKRLWTVAEPLGEAAIRAAVSGLVDSLTAKLEAKLGGPK